MAHKRYLENYPGIKGDADAGVRSWIQDSNIGIMHRIGMPNLEYSDRVKVRDGKHWLKTMTFVDELEELLVKGTNFDTIQREKITTELVQSFGSPKFQQVVFSPEEKHRIRSLIIYYANENMIARQASSALAEVARETLFDVFSRTVNHTQDPIHDWRRPSMLEDAELINTIAKTNSSALDKALKSLTENKVISRSLKILETLITYQFEDNKEEDRPYKLSKLEGKLLAEYSNIIKQNIETLSLDRYLLTKEPVPKMVADIVNERLDKFKELVDKSAFRHVDADDEATIGKNIVLIGQHLDSWFKEFKNANFNELYESAKDRMIEKGEKLPEIKNTTSPSLRVLKNLRDSIFIKKTSGKPKAYMP